MISLRLPRSISRRRLLLSRHGHAGAHALVRARSPAGGCAPTLRATVSRRAPRRRRIRVARRRRARPPSPRRGRSQPPGSRPSSASVATRSSCLAWKRSTRGSRAIDPERLHCFLDRRLARGYIGWVVPGYRGLMQVGLACRQRTGRNSAPSNASWRASSISAGRAAYGRRGGLIPVGGRGVTSSGARRRADRRRGGARVAAVRRRHPYGARVRLPRRASACRSATGRL